MIKLRLETTVATILKTLVLRETFLYICKIIKNIFKNESSCLFVFLFRWTARWSRWIRLQPLTKSGYPIFQGFSLTSMNTFTAHTLKDGIEGIRMRKTRIESGKTSSKKKKKFWPWVGHQFRDSTLSLNHTRYIFIKP